MFGAEALVRTLADCGVRACFANPGTSEMHLVTALDREPRIRSALCLFEGVATGAADAYARIAGVPAMTLLHLGSGYANGGANIHNARRARSPMINVIGDHATHHLQYDAPLTSDVAALVRPNVVWMETVANEGAAGIAAARAFAASLSGARGPVGLILPADAAWTEGGVVAPAIAPTPHTRPDPAQVEAIAAAIRLARKPAVLINGAGAFADGAQASGRLAAVGLTPILDTFTSRQARGAGRFAPQRLPYFGEMALASLEGVDLLVMAGTVRPVAFFAYPDKPSVLVPEGCRTLTLCGPEGDSAAWLAALADALGAPPEGTVQARETPPAPTGPLTVQAVAQSLARHMPENAIVCDDGITSGLSVYLQTMAAAPHDWLTVPGGAIGAGMAMAVGAAVAAPDRAVIALEGDGAAMYAPQALWTMARERLNPLTIVFANRSYKVLQFELARTGAGNPGPTASRMLSLDDPAVDFVSLAQSMGAAAVRCDRAEDFDAALPRLLAQPGPKLIEAVV